MALRIVLVDDDESIKEVLSVIFELDDRLQLVGPASNGVDGVRVVRRLRPDAVLMDVHVPVLGGIEATKQIVAADPNA
jgi:chemotaxis response regulator CheB